MHLLPQHLVELVDPQLVPAGVAPVRAVVLLLHPHSRALSDPEPGRLSPSDGKHAQSPFTSLCQRTFTDGDRSPTSDHTVSSVTVHCGLSFSLSARVLIAITHALWV